MRMPHPTRFATVLFVSLVAGAVPAGRQGRVAAQMPVTKVVVKEARMVEARSTIALVATIEPVRRSRVSSEISGLVQEMPVRQGDLVPAGAVLCKLNEDRAELRLTAEQAKLASLQASHEELLAGTRKEELRRLKALLDEATADYERSEFEMARIDKLYAGKDSNDKEYQDTKADFLRAQRRKIAASAAYNLGVEGPRKETIARAAHQVAEQRAVVDRFAVELRKMTIRAPFTGYVVDRTVEVGEWIGEGDTVVEMVDLHSVLARVNAPETALPHLIVGDRVRVTVDALQRSFDGRIKHILRQADPNARTFPVEIEVDNGEKLLAGGMFARATLPVGPVTQTVAVPKDAIVERGGITYVATVMPGRQGGFMGMLAPVTVGSDVEDWIAVTSGPIRPGTRVITRGTERILPFPTPIEIVDEWGTPVAMPGGAPSHDRNAVPAGSQGADPHTPDRKPKAEGT